MSLFRRAAIEEEARRLFGSNTFLRRRGNAYEIARWTPCNQVQVLGTGRSMVEALLDAASFMEVKSQVSLNEEFLERC